MPQEVPDPLLLSLESICRARLHLRPHALAERMVLALCLDLRREDETALLEWDEALFLIQRHADRPALESCLGLMSVMHPQEGMAMRLRLEETERRGDAEGPQTC